MQRVVRTIKIFITLNEIHEILVDTRDQRNGCSSDVEEGTVFL